MNSTDASILRAIDLRMDQRLSDIMFRGTVISASRGHAIVQKAGGRGYQPAVYNAAATIEPGDSCLLFKIPGLPQYVILTPFTTTGTPNSNGGNTSETLELSPPATLSSLEIVSGTIVAFWNAPYQQAVLFEVQTNTTAGESGATTRVYTRGSFAFITSNDPLYVRVRSISRIPRYSAWTSWVLMNPGSSGGLDVSAFSFITRTPETGLTGATALSALSSGLLKSTTTTGAVTTVSAPSGDVVGTSDVQTLSGKTLTTPTIASLTNAQHSHQNAAGGGTLSGFAITAGTVAAARLGLMTGDSGAGGAQGAVPAPAAGDAAANKFLKADGTWAASSANDSDAIHDNVSGEINALTTKTTPVSADVLLIEDSADTYAKKKILLSSLPGGGAPSVIYSRWDPNAPPVSASALDDEFSDATFNTTLWSTYNFTGGTLNKTEGDLGLKLQWVSPSPFEMLGGIYQPMPTDANRCFTVKVSLPNVDTDVDFGRYVSAGLIFLEDGASSTGDVLTFGLEVSDSTPVITLTRYSDYATFATNETSLYSSGALRALYLRVRLISVDGMWYFEYSADGEVWQLLWALNSSSDPLSSFQHVGVGTRTNIDLQDMTAFFRFFRYQAAAVDFYAPAAGRLMPQYGA